jgi:hypothetical protein
MVSTNYGVGRFTLSFLSHRIGERLFVFIATAGVRTFELYISSQCFADFSCSGPDSRIAHLVRSINSGRLGRRRILRLAIGSYVPVCGAHFPTTHPSQNANLVTFSHWICGQLRRCSGPILDWYTCSACRNLCSSPNLHWAVHLHGT